MVVNDKTKASYDALLGEINGKKLISLLSAFRGCTALVQAPAIPSGVAEIGTAFDGCTSLKEAPVIPNGVTKMSRLFYNCYSLTGVVTVHANPAEYANCFYQTVQPITLIAIGTIEWE